jgi:hypothetical protein
LRERDARDFVGEPVDLVIDPLTREKVRITLPLAFQVDLETVRRELTLPGFIDLTDPMVAKAVSLVYWARREPNGGLPLAFFGGVAHRLRCRASNDPRSGLRRILHDVDVVCLHQNIVPTVRFLKHVGSVAGSSLAIFETPGDRVFNALQGGKRHRFHTTLDEENGGVGLGIVDVLADVFEFCHRFDVRAEVMASPAEHWTLPPALLLLAKLQFIQRIPAYDADKVPDRVLAPFGKREVVIGAETKDVQDILAVLDEFPVGEGVNTISLQTWDRLMRSDWGLWRTVSLNVEAVRRSPVLARLSPSLRDSVEPRIHALQEFLGSLSPPKPRLSFFQPQWWQEVDSAGPTPTSAAVEESTQK